MYLHKNGTRFRKVEQEDLKLLLELKNESWWGTHNVLFANMQDQQKWFENIGDNLVFTIERNILNETMPVGVCVLSNIDNIARKSAISGSILKRYRSGDNPVLVFEAGVDFAFEMFNFNRLEAEVLETNYAAQFLEVKVLGFQIEGKKRMAVYKAGQYYDSLVLGLLRSEWQNQERIRSMTGGCNQNFCHEKATRLVERSRRNIQNKEGL